MQSADDTIAAIATAPGAAARGAVRISGREALAVALRVFRSDNPAGPERPTRACAIAGTVELAPSGDTKADSCSIPCAIPCTLYLWPTKRSYTREPVAELHTFGSPPLLAMLLRAVCAAGARLAEPGEFTLRAFLAGRLDLTQAEAVLGVIDAADRRQLDVALAQLAGGLSGPLASLRDELMNLLADLEAGLDFTEEDIQFVAAAELQSRLAAAAKHIERLLDRLGSRTRADFEPRVALVGWPNVGKSSLFNALLGRSVALVCDSPGTTRDYLTATLPLGDLSCRLIDTAGRELLECATGKQSLPEPRSALDPLAAAAQRMTVEQSEQADLRLLCLDATREPNAWEQSQLARRGDPIGKQLGEQLLVLTKCDTATAGALARCNLPSQPASSVVETSAVAGVGIDELKVAIRDRLAAIESAGAVAATADRCHESLRLAADCLHRAGEIAAAAGGEELVAAEMRASLVELGKVVGTIYTDDILDRVFSRFCIGK